MEVFIFSPEEETSAFDLQNKVSLEVAQARKDYVISVQQNISKDKIDLKNYIGKFVEVNISFADEYDLYGEPIKICSFFKLI